MTVVICSTAAVFSQALLSQVGPLPWFWKNCKPPGLKTMLPFPKIQCCVVCTFCSQFLYAKRIGITKWSIYISIWFLGELTLHVICLWTAANGQCQNDHLLQVRTPPWPSQNPVENPDLYQGEDLHVLYHKLAIKDTQ